MSRYSIILKKTPEEVRKGHLVDQFGFDQDMDNLDRDNPLRRKRTFYLNSGEVAPIGIVFDDPSVLFYGAKVHFFKSHRFFCKSTAGRVAYCCQPNYLGRRPAFRIATIVIKYPVIGEAQDAVKVLPWIFGQIIYDKLRELHRSFPVDQRDVVLRRPTAARATAFAQLVQYEVQAGQDSVWQRSEMKPRILEIHSYLKRTIRSYLAVDYTEEQILEVISQPETRVIIPRAEESAGPPIRQGNRDIHGRLRLNEINIQDFLEDIEPRRNQQRDPRLLDPDPDNFWESRSR